MIINLLIFGFVFTLMVFSSNCLDCKSCFHISHTMENVPPSEVGGLKAALQHFQNFECLSVRTSSIQRKSCDETTPGNNDFVSKCMTTQVRMTAHGMANLTQDATLELTLYGRECSLVPRGLLYGCYSLKSIEKKKRDKITGTLKILVQYWNHVNYDGEVCYHDNTVPFTVFNGMLIYQ